MVVGFCKYLFRELLPKVDYRVVKFSLAVLAESAGKVIPSFAWLKDLFFVFPQSSEVPEVLPFTSQAVLKVPVTVKFTD